MPLDQVAQDPHRGLSLGGDPSPVDLVGAPLAATVGRVLVLSCLPDAPWLPPGGRADVVVHDPEDPAPSPLGLVRLLVTDSDGRIFCRPRTGDRPGWDLPTAPVPEGSPQTAVEQLTTAVFGQVAATELVGCVRNTVPVGTRYDWPAPVAHFAVYRVLDHAVAVLDGIWLDHDDAAEYLGERHWWPLVAVDHGNATALTTELNITWGLWLDDVERDRDRITRSATGALALGMNSPALRELAGLAQEVVWPDVDLLVRQAAAELGLPPPASEAAVGTR
ncbi:hypothetical protein [Promicromonospora sp. NPDC023805]|uniref:hypothetical protein n=1 Tax=Promicromonospora sp. NPDC023805 TaxID=3154696 RepID=UPI003406D592